MEETQEANRWRLAGGPYVGEISALSLLPFSPSPLLLAGTGSELSLYDIKTGNLNASFQVFDGIRVHGITHLQKLQLFPQNKEHVNATSYFSLAVFGERRVKLFVLSIYRDDGNNEFCLDSEQILPAFDHWVLDVCFWKREKQIAIGLSDNSVALWDVTSHSLICRVKSEERCLLYSMRLCGDSIANFRVASGTIYNQIIIWKLLVCEGELMAVNLGRLVGHEGSIFRLAWNNDGSKLMSASDDRSARIWDLTSQNQSQDVPASLALFGHNARIWDCHISDSIIITAGEDCTCRVWDKNGNQIMILKEHIGRGIWRCLYEPSLSLIITAGFDSAIKIHEISSFMNKEKAGPSIQNNDLKQFIISAPQTAKQLGLMDSKSEYVRCLQFSQENILYVSTNNGHLYHVEISDPKDVKWTHVTQVNEKIPIICMDLMNDSLNNEKKDIIALGDGKGNVTVVSYYEGYNGEKTDLLSFTFLAEKERQLLGTYWCKSLGCSYLLTANPRGVIKLWDLQEALKYNLTGTGKSGMVSLVAVFESCFGARIMCVDASTKEEILIAGDNKGNLSIFPFTLDPTNENAKNFEDKNKIPLIDHFKGAHGISSITSIYISESNSDDVLFRTTGGDGCICFFKYRKTVKKMEFIGMKQVKELGMLQSVFSKSDNSVEASSRATHAIGFTSADFIIWDLLNDTKILGIPCGGWRRPYSYHLGADPQHQNCFAYLKDQEIHIHRLWATTHEKQAIPQVLNIQFHGREIHTLSFISPVHKLRWKDNNPSLLVATGCEDGTVRLTKYSSIKKGKWSDSKLLGEHVGGSAVRSICFTPKVHTYNKHKSETKSQIDSLHDDDQLLLISVGSKQVLTCWVLKSGSLDGSFQWFSTHMPFKVNNSDKSRERRENEDGSENDWRYMAVTAFILKCSDVRMSVCFVVVACSDATLVLRALLLPSRLWFDVATLGPQTSPVLALDHIVFTGSSNESYIAISGCTDGTITFWDLTKSITNFMRQISEIQLETLIDPQTRPKTGRGSHGGRKWRSLSYFSPKEEQESSNGKSNELVQVGPLCVLKSVHQSGVNCLSVARFEEGFVLVSGGDDQAVQCLMFGLETPVGGVETDVCTGDFSSEVKIRVCSIDGVASAHSSAVKGIWTDGKWVFSTGLDQRVRIWRLNDKCAKLTEYSHFIISVPEPETVDAMVCDSESKRYLIAVAGRGMQMVEFYSTEDVNFS
ncbi:hypothetical protein LUZ60_015803 [Juncus effusus]|nr:hypothetical protein LUZ60_015803 [Juncus effusus]